MGFIYALTNQVNEKLYIGQTRRDPRERWSEYKSPYRQDGAISRAIRKYGYEQFSMVPLLSVENSRLDEWETLLIVLLGTHDRRHGYNVSTGGDHPVLNSDCCIRRGAKRRGSKYVCHVEHRAHFGRPLSEHHRQRLREGWQKDPKIAEERRERNRNNALLGARARWGKKAGV